MTQLKRIARRWLPTVAVVALTGCGAAATPAAVAPPPTPTELVAAATPTDTPPPTSTTTPTDTPPPTMPEYRPSTRTELAATDPATVALASGQVQLVEFFAFW